MRQELLKNKKRGFVKICSANEAYVTVKLISDNVAFNKSTIYPNLYIYPPTREQYQISNLLYSLRKR